MIKLNVLLAKTDHLASVYKGMVTDYIKFFKKDQGAFRGEKKTYIPKADTVDLDNMRTNIQVQTTVHEKIEWFMDHCKDYVDSLFSVELTNASGARAELKVDGKSWGEFTSLELLRLKSLIENGEVKAMIESLPVRSDSEMWTVNAGEDYQGRDIVASNLSTGIVKTTTKESYILPDPNLDKAKDYTPQLGVKNTVVELGDYTHQRFSGEINQRERAMMLDRRTKLLTGVIEALKTCNEVEAIQSELTSKRVFGYLFDG